VKLFGRQFTFSLEVAFTLLSLLSLAMASLFIYLASDFVTESAINSGFIFEARHNARLVEQTLNSTMKDGVSSDKVQSAIRDTGLGIDGISVELRSTSKVSTPDSDLNDAITKKTEVIRAIDNGKRVRFLYPVLATKSCLSCHTARHQGDVLGVIDLSFPDTSVTVPMGYAIKSSLYYTVFGMWMMFALLYLNLRFKLLGPITSMVNDIRAITTNRDWSHRALPNRDIRELMSLSDDFNKLIEVVQEEQEALREISLRDPLTGLLNRRGFNLAINAELMRSNRHGCSFSIVLIDLDGFKFINDTYGHPAGDFVLSELAARMGRCLRDVDSFARLGGDEFIVILPETDAAGGFVAAQRLREALVGELFVLPPSGVRHRVTASIGVASYPRDGKDEESLTTAVDAVLYEAKKHGKDCVVVASPTNDLFREME